jgi:hypothetical protein
MHYHYIFIVPEIHLRLIITVVIPGWLHPPRFRLVFDTLVAVFNVSLNVAGVWCDM